VAPPNFNALEGLWRSNMSGGKIHNSVSDQVAVGARARDLTIDHYGSRKCLEWSSAGFVYPGDRIRNGWAGQLQIAITGFGNCFVGFAIKFATGLNHGPEPAFVITIGVACRCLCDGGYKQQNST
jgi:hypothetical protein